jgi:tetratricopeptide (TPR) repeat protein
MAKGFYHYSCLKDYDTAVRYFEQARPLLPNSSRISQSLAYVARRRGQWDLSESYLNEAERLDPRNVYLLTQHAISYYCLRRFPEALRKFDQVLNITPDDACRLGAKIAAQWKGCQGVVQPNMLSGENESIEAPVLYLDGGVL